ncbi:hypothetical protein LPJ68_000030 [Coemansia sp. RSA 1086]|nr:hypothetical protein LPJ68_000030 [Coemansia sp. RSA 1086]
MSCSDNSAAEAAAAHDAVKDYYGKVLSTTSDLKTSACSARSAPHPIVCRLIKSIPTAVNDKFYGCGNPLPLGIEGKDVLDLGSGSGRDCYVAAALVGPNGSVTGVDMTDEQLQTARGNVEEFGKTLGYAPKLNFVTGYIEDLKAAGIPNDSADICISNCVVNLSPNKRQVFSSVFDALRVGGEFHFSDMYADQTIPESLRQHKMLHGEGLSGALFTNEFERIVTDIGFYFPRILTITPVKVYDPQLKQLVGDIKYFSITYRLFKLSEQTEHDDKNIGYVATYLGTIIGHEDKYVLDIDNTFERNVPVHVSGSTGRILKSSNVIEFPQLDTLVMSYENGVSNEEIKTELHFPNLKTFKLKATHSDMTLAKFPKEIDRVKVCGTLQAFEVLRDVEKIQHLEADLKNIDDGTAGIVLPIRNLFDQNRVGKSGKLKLASDMTLLPQDLRLLKITHLNYKASIEQDMVLEFIKRLDMLIEVEFDNVLDDFIDVDYDSAETISTSLKSLVLQYNSRYGCNYVEPHLVNYLLLYLPSLQKLTATDIKDDLVKLHILQYKVRFPHLDDVDLSICGSLQNIVLDASGTELTDEFVSMSLRDLADRAKAAAPSVLVLYDVGVLADAEQTEDIGTRHFIQFVDSIPSNVMLILESGAADAMLPASIRRSRALEHKLEVPVPRLWQRREILCAIQQSTGEELEFLDKVANATAGYVARDIAALFRQAILKKLRQKQTEPLELKLQQLAIADSCLKWQHFADSLHIVRPSQQLSFESSRPTRRWTDIGGYAGIRRKLQQFMRLATSETTLQLGITPPSGVLLYGPSGCGKTVLAQAMIGESHCNVINIRGSELFSKYLGETEARLRQLFEAARAAAPCVVFMDEVDSIAAKREWSSVESGGPSLRVLSTLLNEMDGVHATRGVVVVGCTNQIERIDDAIARPGRFDELVEISMPTAEDRQGILQTLALKSPFASDVDIEYLSQVTGGFSGAALEQLVRDAGLAAMRSNKGAHEIAMADFNDVLQNITSSFSG